MPKSASSDLHLPYYIITSSDKLSFSHYTAFIIDEAYLPTNFMYNNLSWPQYVRFCDHQRKENNILQLKMISFEKGTKTQCT